MPRTRGAMFERIGLALIAPRRALAAAGRPEGAGRSSADAVGLLAQRRITDALSSKNPTKAFEQRRANYVAGDTDLTWTRLTPWRAQTCDIHSGPQAKTQARVSP